MKKETVGKSATLLCLALGLGTSTGWGAPDPVESTADVDIKNDRGDRVEKDARDASKNAKRGFHKNPIEKPRAKLDAPVTKNDFKGSTKDAGTPAAEHESDRTPSKGKAE